MSKYVYVVEKEYEHGKYYKVSDFSLETIRKLPFYNKKYIWFKLLEGRGQTLRETLETNPDFTEEDCDYYEGFEPDDIYSVYDSVDHGTVVYGKKLTMAEVHQLLLNNPRYKTMLETDQIEAFNTYMAQDLGDPDFLDEAGTAEKYYDEHYYIFSPPDNFFRCKNGKTFSIEEFDSNIILNYIYELSALLTNSVIGYNYYKKYQNLFEVFDKYFKMLFSVRDYFKTLQDLFSTIRFDFTIYGLDNENPKRENTIGFFLDLYKLTIGEQNNISLWMLQEYKKIVTKGSQEDNKKPEGRT